MRAVWLSAILLCTLGLGALTAPAFAEESCLDPADPLGEAGQRKGVQKLPFLKRLRAELSVWGGFYANDLLSTSYTFGGAVAFYPFEDWGFEVSLNVTPYTLAIEKPLTEFFAGEVFHKSWAYVAVANAIWAPIHFKLKASEHHIAYGDLLFYLGAGDTINDTVQGITFDGGIGLKIYANRFFGVRFDLRDYVMVQEAIGVQRVTNSLVGTFGFSLFVPHPRPYAR